MKPSNTPAGASESESHRSPIDTWIGLDQTGAVIDGGNRARVLPAVLATASCNGVAQFWIQAEDSKPLRLSSLLPEALAALLKSTTGRAELDARVALVIDCVLGLPGGRRDLWEWFEEAARIPSPAFGRTRAEEFFRTVLASGHIRESAAGGSLPRRKVEALAGANSVFASRPFQKNIQTGTYRFWRELGLGARINGGGPWLDLWPFDAPGKRALAMEGFPSWMWKQVFGCATRDLDALPQAFESAFRTAGIRPLFRRIGHRQALGEAEAWSTLKGDADLCDALVLAAGGMLLHRRGALLDPKIRAGAPRGEGWIAGVPFPEDAGD